MSDHEIKEVKLSPAQKLQAEYNHIATMLGHNDAQLLVLQQEREPLIEKLKQIQKRAQNLPKEQIEELKKDIEAKEEVKA